MITKEDLEAAVRQKGRDKLPGILMVAAECAPFAKTGGLADVAGTLPRYLNDLGFDVRVMMPLHRIVKDKYLPQMTLMQTFSVNLGWRSQYVGLYSMVYNGVTHYFIDNEFFFGDAIYRGGNGEGEQYAYFTRAVVDAIPYLGDFVPDIVHVNDWHTAMLPMLMKTQYMGYMQGSMKTLFTIHNIRYQGKFSFEFVGDLLGIDSRYWTSEFLESYGCANFMKAGLVFADMISTVSPTYAREICSSGYFGEGMEGILNARSADLRGIVNGIDTAEFDPQNDEYVPHPFTAQNLDGKYEDKKALLAELNMTIAPNTPLFSMVSRLTEQKGIDLIRHVFDEMMQAGIGVIFLGTGDQQYEDFLRWADYNYPGRVRSLVKYENALSHRIYAGSDFFLMPSKFEPCGISQMIAMRYGTLPIAHETGGLKDTVEPYNKYTGAGTGFTFANYNAHELLWAVRSAAEVYNDKVALGRLIENAMSTDFSFEKSAGEYGLMFLDML